MTGPFVGGGLALGSCVSNIGDAIICGIVGPEKVLVAGDAIGTVVLPVVGGYQAHKSIKDAKATCRAKKGMNSPLDEPLVLSVILSLDFAMALGKSL